MRFGLVENRIAIFNSRMLRAFAFLIVVAIANARGAEPQPESPPPATNAPVDQLIPWLLGEGGQLRGIEFRNVIFDTTGKRVLAIDAKNEVDQRVIKAISAACGETMKKLNAPESAIQKIQRINEVSSHFEDSLRELLNSTSGLSCEVPRTANGKAQRSGYPDLRIVDVASKRDNLSVVLFR